MKVKEPAKIANPEQSEADRVRLSITTVFDFSPSYQSHVHFATPHFGGSINAEVPRAKSWTSIRPRAYPGAIGSA